LPYLPDAHIGVAEDRVSGIQFREARSLPIARRLNAGANGL
jgi:hypothetical protein